jgi:hypothetical protein
MVNRAFLENGVEVRNGKDAALGQRLEKLRRDFGPTFLAALADLLTIEILLAAGGTPAPADGIIPESLKAV